MKLENSEVLSSSFSFSILNLFSGSFLQTNHDLPFLRALGLEVIERITERKRNKRIAGTDSCDGLQVGCDDLTYIPGRIENIPERKRSRQPTVHQLLANGEIHIPESIRTPLGCNGRTDQIAVHLDTGIFKDIERVVPHDIVVRTCLFSLPVLYRFFTL